MKLKNLKNGLWELNCLGIKITGTYEECQNKFLSYMKMWGIE